MVQHKAQDVSARPRTEDIAIHEDINFKSMLLPKHILQGLKKSGYIKPSPIQRKALPLVRCGLDLIVQAKAGTGKTCVFAIAALELVQPNLAHLQAVVLAPTREIALQITDVFNAVGCGLKGLKTSCFIGGYPISQDMENAKGCQIAVGAPGRMRHLLEQGLLNAKRVRLFVLDEADKLMEEAFAGDINEIFSYLPVSKQVLSFSATYSDQLIESLSLYMHRGQYVTPNQPNAANPSTTLLLGIRQFVSVLDLHVDRLAKLRLKEKQLVYLLKSVPFNQCLVFSNLHSRAVSVCNMLRAQGWSADWIAGKQSQEDRVIAMSQLKEQRVRVLITTDLTARGIDVENVNLIINLDVPMDHQTYLHRMGRAGRYGSHGMVITLVFTGEELTAFQKLLGAIGGTSQAINCVPESLKKVDLWTLPEEELKQVHGIVQPTKTADNEESEEILDISTDTDERISAESSDELDDSVGRESTPKKDDSLEERVCRCNLYEVQPSDVENIGGSSLFSISKKEAHWREVLPIVINEGKIPLNIPIALFGSKLVRVKHFNKNTGEIRDCNENINCNAASLIQFKEHSNDRNYLTFEEIDAEFTKTEKQHLCVKNEISKIREERNEIYEQTKSTISAHEENINERKQYLMDFDSFDLVGWMAVDDTCNILEHVKTERCDVFEFALIKCSAGKSHIKVVPPFSPEVRVNNDCENHISTFNLEVFKLEAPFSFSTIADKFSSFPKTVKPAVGYKVNEKVETHKKEKPGNYVKNDKYVVKNGKKSKQNKNKLNQNNHGNENCKKYDSKQLAKNAPYLTNGHKENIAPNELKNTKQIQRSKRCPSESFKNQNHSTDSNSSSVSETFERLSINSHLLKNEILYKKSSLSKKIATESRSVSDSSSSEFSEEFNPYSGENGHQSSSGSEESGPYVDMTQNLAKLQELHEFDEYNSGNSDSESDVLGAVGPKPVQKVHSVCKQVTQKSGKQKEYKFVKEPRYYENQMKAYKLSSESLELDSVSNLSNRQSFRTAHSCSDEQQYPETRHPTRKTRDHCRHYHNKHPHNNVPLKVDHRDENVPASASYYPQNPNIAFTKQWKYDDIDAVSERVHIGRNKKFQEHFKKHKKGIPDNTPTKDRPFEYEHYQYCDNNSRQTSQTLTSRHLFSDWYASWYAEVRQRAKELECFDYINTMSSP